ncbi:MAG: hypothetical protein AB7O32_00225 [Vicinamibacterales bacterium]
MPSLFTKLPFVSPGQAIRAEDWNALVAALNTMPDLAAGAGITIHRSEGKVIIASRPSNGEELFGIITAFTGNADGDWPENIRYDAVARGRPETKVTGRLPDFGRSGRGRDYKAVPCKVGCPCKILRLPDESGEAQSYLSIFEGGELGERKLYRGCQSRATRA